MSNINADYTYSVGEIAYAVTVLSDWVSYGNREWGIDLQPQMPQSVLRFYLNHLFSMGLNQLQSEPLLYMLSFLFD